MRMWDCGAEPVAKACISNIVLVRTYVYFVVTRLLLVLVVINQICNPLKSSLLLNSKILNIETTCSRSVSKVVQLQYFRKWLRNNRVETQLSIYYKEGRFVFLFVTFSRNTTGPISKVLLPLESYWRNHLQQLVIYIVNNYMFIQLTASYLVIYKCIYLLTSFVITLKKCLKLHM